MSDSVRPYTFPSADGKATVEGMLHLPANDGSLTPTLIVCHGRWNNLDLPLLRDFCQRAAEAGWRALRFNFRYVTQKTNPSANGSAEIADLEGALAALSAEYKPSPARTYLAGKSLGAIVASHVAATHPGLGGYIALGYPLHGPGGAVTADTTHLARLGCPALFVVGDHDPFCQITLLRPVLDTIPTSCTLEIIPGGDHSYRPPTEPERSDAYLPLAIEATLAWLNVQIGD
jgi:predicted alpha/beta-hydrolase family hydrolase